MKKWLFVLLLAGVLACSENELQEPVFHADTNPEKLSDWGQVVSTNEQLVLARDVTPYDLNTPLFSDYAHKLRTVWLPAGTSAEYREDEVFEFPVGTVITKTFYYNVDGQQNSKQVLKTLALEGLPDNALPLQNVRLIETRILARRKDGWVALPYVWNQDQTEAILKRAGDIKRLTLVAADSETEFAYLVPDTNQCAGCHATNNTTRKIQPIGPKARHLNRDFAYSNGSENQLVRWQNVSILKDAPAPLLAGKNAVWTDERESLEARTRAYLDANCSHCHNKVGPADTSGLHLEPSDPIGPNFGICKLPIAAGTGTGGRQFGIVPGDPDQSIFSYRVESDNPAEMMPELGRALVHTEGAALIRKWIAQLEGSCGASL